MGWMVIIGHRSSKNTYSANKMRDNSRYHWDTSQRRPFYYWWCNVDDRRVLWFRPKSNQMPSQPRTFFIFSVWQVFHIATHKVCPEQSSVTLSSIQKQLTSVKAMRSLYLLGFFGLFASLHPSLGNNERPCDPFFLSSEREMLLAEDTRTLIITPKSSKFFAMTTVFTLIKLWS